MKMVANSGSLVTALTVLAHGAGGLAATLPKQASGDTPWVDLKAILSSSDILTPSSVTEWNEQCVQVFRDVTNFPGIDGSFAAVSNYLILNQTSGLCLDHVSCAFENCEWPSSTSTFPIYPPDTSAFAIYEGSNDLTDDDLKSDKLLLPAMVLQPRTVSDIVSAVKFCQRHDVGITVKVAGHSYFGASNGKNTLLIKMNPNYPKYAIDGSLTECSDVLPTPDDDSVPSANMMACAVATSRGKNAVLRVGGGEIFDEAYRAVSFNWNSVNDNKYHVVGGGAGTVSAAGGWMASGGLSGTTGMRLFGVGIDQVVALEMVLPSGQHVRFGPTEWVEKDIEDGGYPATTAVTGYCNMNPEGVDEILWDWQVCDPPIDFDELWFAVRGGGGGTYGIVTSLHYQLHDHPGPMSLVALNADAYPADAAETVSPEAAFYFTTKYIEFVLKYLYVPETLNVTQFDSRGCNSADTFNLSPFVPGLLWCYGSSSTTLVSKWQEYISDPIFVEEAMAQGVPEDVLTGVQSLIVPIAEFDTYADYVLAVSVDNPGIPEGRLGDTPAAAVVPVLWTYPYLNDGMGTHIPLELIKTDVVGLSQLLASDVLTTNGGTMYAMGGVIPFTDDDMNSLSPTRRNAAFLMSVNDGEIRNQYYDLIHGGLDMEGDFPGSSCHNHALVFEMGPLKDDWTKSCPLDWPQHERDEKCISQNEAAWGTANLAKLEAIKASIDPNKLFICTSGVGYSNPAKPPTDEDEPDEPDEPDDPSPPTINDDVSGSDGQKFVTLSLTFMLNLIAILSLFIV